eukprot:CAMPEP_0194136118 /NCGR_PEP_ID=MMETSP0152-20130528/6144_1 /TAXON_ID=1049557 /ORGANISM="Thalassiothrix antarctica, Strain L6-D1" /LENGTH=265 /DNA_ID=CAMNT_0038832633 /DNA_START=640 /DNA_END=1437 /DNA_ORIENTATION=+
MTRERIKMLDDIGFIWDSREGRSQTHPPKHWERNFNRLVKYKNVHKHCLVPYDYLVEPSLARWVKKQRQQYKLRLQGKFSNMTQTRIKMLDDIGFIWDSREARWQEILEELIEYKQKNGDCMVPPNNSSNPHLASWVKQQRREYKLFQEGHSSNMTHKRILILEKYGFNWRPYTFKHNMEKNKAIRIERQHTCLGGYRAELQIPKIQQIQTKAVLIDNTKSCDVSDITNDEGLKDDKHLKNDEHLKDNISCFSIICCIAASSSLF